MKTRTAVEIPFTFFLGRHEVTYYPVRNKVKAPAELLEQLKATGMDKTAFTVFCRDEFRRRTR